METREPSLLRNKRVGKIRQDNIVKVLSDWGYNVRSVIIEENEADIWVHKGKKTVALIEVLNWNKKGYLNTSRANKIIENLSVITNNRYLVCSFPENVEKYRKKFEKNEIKIICLGFQTLPKDIYEREVDPEKAKEKGIRTQSPEVLEELKVKLSPLRNIKVKKGLSLKIGLGQET